MKNAIQYLLALATLAMLIGCAGAVAPSRPGATIDGNIVAGGSQALRVEVPNTAVATTPDASGHFLLLDVPAGSSKLRFHGGDIDAILEIEAVLEAEHRTIAVSVEGKTVTEHLEQSQSEFEGKIEAIGGANLTVAGRKVVTTSATVFRHGDATLALADLHVGDSVEVEGSLQDDHSVLARTVKVEVDDAADGGDGDHGGGDGDHDGGHGGDGDHDGGHGGGDGDLDGGHGGGDHDGGDGDHDGGNGGGGGDDADGGSAPQPDPGEAKGAIESLRADGLTVAGKPFAVDMHTVIRRGDHTLTFADLRLGWNAEVHGTSRTGLNPLAATISISDSH